MFDWNDEELANIWGEAGGSEDHIVPYTQGSDGGRSVDLRDQNTKDLKQEFVTSKPEQQKPRPTTNDFHQKQQESSSHLCPIEGLATSGLGTESLSNFPLPNAFKRNKGPMGAEASISLAETNNESSRDDTPTLAKEQKIFQNPLEDVEHDDFVDYSWANIGSFDDLDRILSNDDPVFGHSSLGGADEPWSSSRNIENSPINSFLSSADSPTLPSGTSKNAFEKFEIKTEYDQYDEHSFTSNHKQMIDPTSDGLQNVRLVTNWVEDAGDKSTAILKETTVDKVWKGTTANAASLNTFATKVNKQKKLVKHQTSIGGNKEEKLFRDFSDKFCSNRSQFQQYSEQVVPTMVQSYPSTLLSQQRQVQGLDYSPYQNYYDQHMSRLIYGNLTGPCPGMPVKPLKEDDYSQFLSGSDVTLNDANHLECSSDSLSKPLTMTPQEKIEKLRRRQQMQAMIAIQKQQKQFNQHASGTHHFFTKQRPQEYQNQHLEEADIEIKENMSVLPSLHPNTPLEQNGSNNITAAMDQYSLEDTVLHQLQEIITKLDIRVRLCIRDSLFRLAQNALQRNYSIDTSSGNKSNKDKHDAVAEEKFESHDRSGGMVDAETETNPLDRIVAHLLFHRSNGGKSGKYSETLECSISSPLPCESETAPLINWSHDSLPDAVENKQDCPSQGAEHLNENEFFSSPFVGDASYNLPPDGGAMEVEGSG